MIMLTQHRHFSFDALLFINSYLDFQFCHCTKFAVKVFHFVRSLVSLPVCVSEAGGRLGGEGGGGMVLSGARRTVIPFPFSTYKSFAKQSIPVFVDFACTHTNRTAPIC